MAMQIVMDHSGDTRHYFETGDVKAVSKAEARFKELTSLGFTAAVRSASGDIAVTRSFDPAASRRLIVVDMLAKLLISATQYLRSSLATCLRKLLDLREHYEAIAHRREARGITLLREWFSVDQRTQFDTSKSFVVVGGNSGKRYRISYGTGNNVHELDDADRPVMGWCFVPIRPPRRRRCDACSKNRVGDGRECGTESSQQVPMQPPDRSSANVFRVRSI